MNDNENTAKREQIKRQLEACREAASSKYQERKKKDEEADRIEKFKQNQATYLPHLHWSNEDIADVMSKRAVNEAFHSQRIQFTNAIKMNHNGEVWLFDIRQLMHWCQMQNDEPPRFDGKPFDSKEWQRALNRWKQVGPEAEGLKALSPFKKFMLARSDQPFDPTEDFSTSTRAKVTSDDHLLQMEGFGVFFAVLSPNDWERFTDGIQAPSESLAVQILGMSREAFKPLYLTLGSPSLAVPDGYIGIHPSLLKCHDFHPNTMVQLRFVSLPRPRPPPQISVELLPLGQANRGEPPITAEHIQQCLQRHRVLRHGQAFWVYADPRQPFKSAQAYIVASLFSERGNPVPALDIHNQTVAVDFGPQIDKISCHEAFNIVCADPHAP